MTVYKYVGRTTTGTIKKGIVDAPSKQDAIGKLRSQGINAREIDESKSILHKELSLGGKVKNEDFVIYSRQFATLIRAGVSILESTKILAEQTSSKPLKMDCLQSKKMFARVFPFLMQLQKIQKFFLHYLSI